MRLVRILSAPGRATVADVLWLIELVRQLQVQLRQMKALAASRGGRIR